MKRASAYQIVKKSVYGLETFYLVIFWNDNTTEVRQFHSENGATNAWKQTLLKEAA